MPESRPGQSVLVQETLRSGMARLGGGKPVNIRKDAMGMMLLDAPPGEQEIVLEFVTPLENQVGRVDHAADPRWVIVGLFVIGSRRERSGPIRTATVRERFRHAAAGIC